MVTRVFLIFSLIKWSEMEMGFYGYFFPVFIQTAFHYIGWIMWARGFYLFLPLNGFWGIFLPLLPIKLIHHHHSSSPSSIQRASMYIPLKKKNLVKEFNCPFVVLAIFQKVLHYCSCRILSSCIYPNCFPLYWVDNVG